MDTYTTGVVLGIFAGIPLGILGLVAYQTFSAYLAHRKHFEMDTSVERLRALGRHPSQAELQLLAEENIERYRRTR
jgi:hypothetical protein